MGAHEGEKIREADALDTKVGARSIGPLLFERLPAYSTYVDPVECPGDCIEPRSKDDNV
jgi:hypothetical protein